MLTGIILGFWGAFTLTRVMNGLLFEVGATDPRTFLGVSLLFILIALAASYVPAQRAMRIDPITALRAGKIK